MTPAQIQIIQDTFPLVQEAGGAMTQLFYGRLFQTAPGLRPLFRGDINIQARKFSEMLNGLVDGLPDLEQQAPALRAMGLRHEGYGVRPEHYQVVAQALLWALAQAIEPEFTHAAKAAWTALIFEVAAMMQVNAK